MNSPRSLKDHPLTQNQPCLPTAPIELFANTLRQWLDLLIPGALVWGNSRAGKTYATTIIMDHLPEFLGYRIPAAMLSTWGPSGNSSTEKRFFEELLLAFEYPLYSGTGHIKMLRVIEYVLDAMTQADEHRFLLMVDEAHQLTVPQYFHLANLHNRIAQRGKALIVILIGMPKLLDVRKQFRQEGRAQLIGRFMAAEHQFDGLRGLKDLSRIVNAIDEKLKHPADSNFTYTACYVPLGYASGFRLSHYVDRIWEILECSCQKEGIPNIDHLPMQPITALLRKILLDLASIDKPHLELTTSLIQNAVYRVAIVQIESLIDQYIQNH